MAWMGANGGFGQRQMANEKRSRSGIGTGGPEQVMFPWRIPYTTPSCVCSSYRNTTSLPALPPHTHTRAQVRFTRGKPFLWDLTWNTSKIANSRNQASQDFNPAAGRTALNKVELNGPESFISAAGTYEPVVRVAGGLSNGGGILACVGLQLTDSAAPLASRCPCLICPVHPYRVWHGPPLARAPLYWSVHLLTDSLTHGFVSRVINTGRQRGDAQDHPRQHPQRAPGGVGLGPATAHRWKWVI